MMGVKALNARRVLGTALVLNLLRRMWRRRSPRRWLDQMAAEGLSTTPAEIWPIMAASGACIGCGVCDAVVPAGLQPSIWLRAEARQPGDAPLALAALAQLRPHAAAIRAVCPTDVRVDAVLRLWAAQAQSSTAPLP